MDLDVETDLGMRLYSFSPSSPNTRLVRNIRVHRELSVLVLGTLCKETLLSFSRGQCSLFTLFFLYADRRFPPYARRFVLVYNLVMPV